MVMSSSSAAAGSVAILPHDAVAVFRFRLASSSHALVALSSLAVDPELSPERSSKTLSVDGSLLVCRFSAVDGTAKKKKYFFFTYDKIYLTASLTVLRFKFKQGLHLTIV